MDYAVYAMLDVKDESHRLKASVTIAKLFSINNKDETVWLVEELVKKGISIMSQCSPAFQKVPFNLYCPDINLYLQGQASW